VVTLTTRTLTLIYNDIGSIDYTLSTVKPAGRFYFLDEGLSILIDQVYPKDNKFHKIIYDTLKLMNSGAYSQAKSLLVDYDKTFNYDDDIQEINVTTTNEILFHAIILQHLLRPSEAQKLLDEAKDTFSAEIDDNVPQYVLYLIKKYPYTTPMEDIMSLKKETESFKNKLHKETIFFIDLLTVIQYVLADRYNDAHEYLLSLTYLGNTVYKPFFWLIFAKVKFSVYDITEANHCLSLSSYFIHKTDNIMWICLYYELLCVKFGAMSSYILLYEEGEKIQQILRNTLFRNDNSTCTELLKIYDQIISPLCHGFESTIITPCTACGGKGCILCCDNNPSYDETKISYAFEWAEFAKTRGWIHEPIIANHILHLANQTINIPANCVCITYVIYGSDDYGPILCVILSSTGVCNIQLDYKMDKNRLWDGLQSVVESVNINEDLTFTRTLDEMKELTDIYPDYIKPVESFLSKNHINKIKIVSEYDFFCKIIGSKLQKRRDQYRMKQNCCYVEYSIDHSYHNQNSIKEIYCYVVLHNKTVHFNSIKIRSYKQFKEDIELLNWTTDDVSSPEILAEKRYQLYQILIEPISSILYENDIKRIKFVPDGVLTYLPFSNLLIDKEKQIYLVDKFEISYVPSVCYDQYMLTFERSDTKIQQLSLFSTTDIDPAVEKQFNLFDENDESFPLTKEIDVLTTFFQTHSIHCQEPNKKTTKDDLIRYFNNLKEINLPTIFHYCGHTAFREQTISAYYALSGAMILEGAPTDALFYSTHIAKYDLSNIKLAFLNSCSTYRGRSTVSASGHLGLARAFYVAGVQCVIATLASEYDYSTIFAKIFYDYIGQGKTISTAFTDAIREFKTMNENEYESPEYWGSFLLFGNGDITTEFKKLQKN
jgi:CHAT domain-containing protein